MFKIKFLLLFIFFLVRTGLEVIHWWPCATHCDPWEQIIKQNFIKIETSARTWKPNPLRISNEKLRQLQSRFQAPHARSINSPYFVSPQSLLFSTWYSSIVNTVIKSISTSFYFIRNVYGWPTLGYNFEILLPSPHQYKYAGLSVESGPSFPFDIDFWIKQAFHSIHNSEK